MVVMEMTTEVKAAMMNEDHAEHGLASRCRPSWQPCCPVHVDGRLRRSTFLEALFLLIHPGDNAEESRKTKDEVRRAVTGATTYPAPTTQDARACGREVFPTEALHSYRPSLFPVTIAWST